MTSGVTQAQGVTAVPGTGTGGTGTVTSIIAGAGLTGGTISISGTIASDQTFPNLWTAAQTITRAPAVNTSVEGLILQDTTPATVNGQQYSPMLHFIGQGWQTNTGGSQTIEWKFEGIPVQGAASPSATFLISNQINGGGFNPILFLTSSAASNCVLTGRFQITGNLQVLGSYVGPAGLVLISGTAPTISSGFGTAPSIANNNGTASFAINVGTGGTATSGVIGLPAASHGWSCFASDVGATPTGRTEPTAMTANSVTLTNFSRTTGSPVAWTAGEIIQVSCFAN